jgi:hypothetical protein
MLSVVIPTWKIERATRMKRELRVPGNDFHIPYKMGAVEAMTLGAEMCVGDYIAFLHDDIEIHDQDWVSKVENFFAGNPRIGMIGFGGAIGLGTDDIYKRPYDLHQLARIDFVSNMVDAEAHGRRSTEPVQVAVLDGFIQIIRTKAYEEVGGWKRVKDLGVTFHCYDTAMACLLHAAEWETWMLPISCTHLGGRTSTTPEYDEWLRKQGINGDLEVHQAAHRVI